MKPHRPGPSAKRAANNARDSEKRFRALIENSSDAVSLISADGIILYESPSVRRLLGYSPEELIGRNVFELLHPDDLPRIMPIFSQLLQQPHQTVKALARYRHKNGAWLWIEGVGKNLIAEPGVQAIVVNYRDITERKQAEKALLESESRLLTVLEATPIPITLTSLEDGIVLYANSALEDLLGVSISEIIGQRAANYYADPADRSQVLAELKRLGSLRDYEVRVRRRDDAFVWVSLSIEKTMLDGQTCLLSSFYDITERKRAEAVQAAIYQISEAANKAEGLNELYQSVHMIIGQVMPAQNFYIAFYDTEKDLLSFPYYVDEVDGSASIPATKPGRGMTEYVIRTGKPLLSDLSNFEELARKGEIELVGAPSPIWVGAPLIVDGRTIGAIALQDYHNANVYTERELRMLEYVSSQVAKAIERTRLIEDVQKNNRILSALQEATVPLIRQTELSEVLQEILKQATGLFETTDGYIYFVKPDESEIVLSMGIGPSSQYIGSRLKNGEGLAGKVWQTGQRLTVDDYDSWSGRSKIFEDTRLYATAAVPLTSKSKMIGVLGIGYLMPDRKFDHEGLELLTRFAELAAIAIENARLYTLSQQELAERRMAQEAWREAEAKYRELVERLPVVVYTSELGTTGAWHYVSPQIEPLVGFTPEEWMTDPNLWYRQIHPDDRDQQEALEEQSYARGEPFEGEYRIFTRAGREIWIRDSAQILPPRDGELPIVQGVLVDITERKRAEEALHESEETTRLIIDTALDAVITIDQDGQIAQWNDQAEAIFGWTRAEAVGQRLSKLIIPPDLRAKHELGLKHYSETGEGPVLDKRIEFTAQRRGGHNFPVELTIHALKANNKVSFAAFVRDITERKQAEENLRAAEAKYRTLVEHISAITYTALLDDAKTRVYVSPQIETLLGYTQAEYLANTDLWKKILHPDDQERVLTEAARFYETGEPFVSDYRSVARDGRVLWFHDEAVIVEDENIHTQFIQGVKIDITERKQAEGNLRAAETRYRTLVEQLPIIIYVNSASDISLTTYVSPQIRPFLGYTQEEWLDDPKFWRKVLHPEDRERVLAEVERVDQSGEPFSAEYRVIARDGRVVWIRDQSTLLRDSDGHPLLWQGLMIDITESKLAEDNLRASELKFHTLAENIPSVVYQCRDDERYTFLYLNDAIEELTGYPPKAFLEDSLSFFDLYHPDDLPAVLVPFTAQSVIEHGSFHITYRIRHKSGEWRWVDEWGTGVLDHQGAIQYLEGVMVDITAVKLAEDKIKRQVERLKALRTIDMFIAGGTNLHLTLQTLLNQAVLQLGVDAADILLLNASLHTLEYAEGVGFRTKVIEQRSTRIGEGFAGKAALEREMVGIPDISASQETFVRQAHWAGEGFTSYYGVPLIAKGEIKGVLEIFHRSRLDVDSEWTDFLESLAGQAALAIDNASLFDSLQRSNLELGLAYETTLEGWSAALDLRDKETEGHTQRVTNLTLKLAEAMGLSERERVHMRRGALLHDIGKMGIPDRILLKPDQLTSDEWEIMRQHPIYAYNLLSPITHLRPALDIPYCHHEKWDGTGYPRGLKNEAIPLSARIFAVADVWDALCSDRPYRPAWTRQKALEHVKSLSGIHFDPKVVDVFLQVVDQG